MYLLGTRRRRLQRPARAAAGQQPATHPPTRVIGCSLLLPTTAPWLMAGGVRGEQTIVRPISALGSHCRSDERWNWWTEAHTRCDQLAPQQRGQHCLLHDKAIIMRWLQAAKLFDYEQKIRRVNYLRVSWWNCWKSGFDWSATAEVSFVFSEMNIEVSEAPAAKTALTTRCP